MTRKSVRDTGLYDRVKRDFGGWRQALEAAGIAPPEPMTPRCRRGLPEPLMRQLGKLSDDEIAKLAGVSTMRVRRYRLAEGSEREQEPEDLDILRQFTASQIAEVPPEELEEARRQLDVRLRTVLERRILAEVPERTQELRLELGVKRRRLHQLQQESVVQFLAALQRSQRAQGVH